MNDRNTVCGELIKVYEDCVGADLLGLFYEVAGIELAHRDVEFVGRHDLVCLVRNGDEGCVRADILTDRAAISDEELI